VLFEKSGIPVAAVVTVDDLKRLQGLDASREEDFKALDATRAAFKDIPDQELEREVNRAVSEARKELYGKRSARRSA
jgi:hypothetical protein